MGHTLCSTPGTTSPTHVRLEGFREGVEGERGRGLIRGLGEGNHHLVDVARGQPCQARHVAHRDPRLCAVHNHAAHQRVAIFLVPRLELGAGNVVVLRRLPRVCKALRSGPRSQVVLHLPLQASGQRVSVCHTSGASAATATGIGTHARRGSQRHHLAQEMPHVCTRQRDAAHRSEQAFYLVVGGARAQDRQCNSDVHELDPAGRHQTKEGTQTKMRENTDNDTIVRKMTLP